MWQGCDPVSTFTVGACSIESHTFYDKSQLLKVLARIFIQFVFLKTEMNFWNSLMSPGWCWFLQKPFQVTMVYLKTSQDGYNDQLRCGDTSPKPNLCSCFSKWHHWLHIGCQRVSWLTIKCIDAIDTTEKVLIYSFAWNANKRFGLTLLLVVSLLHVSFLNFNNAS